MLSISLKRFLDLKIMTFFSKTSTHLFAISSEDAVVVVFVVRTWIEKLIC
jgi:hypothetical protein